MFNTLPRINTKYVFFAAIALLIAADVLLGFRYGWALAGVLLVALIGWAAALWLGNESRAERAALEGSLRAITSQLDEESRRGAEERRRLDALLRLNRSLAEIQDEQALMSSVLGLINELSGSLGSSFVPVDEWRQPLPPFTYGQLPEPVLRAWSLHLTSGMLRERCGNCRVLHSEAGGCPLHPQEVGEALTVFCLPLEHQRSRNGKGAAVDSRPLGVLHLYLPPGRSLEPELRSFLDSLLPEIALAYENAHLRAQELTTLRQIQMLHSAESDFSTSLGSLLEELRSALEIDCILVRLRPSADERLSNLHILRGDPCAIRGEMETIFQGVLAGQESASETGVLPVWLALPLQLPDGPVLGLLLAAGSHPRAFHPRQKAILHTVSAQAALLVENERMLRSLEYQVIIQERARLAREIHDGLAQTLAFLKLQAAQMQNYLAQGDMARLSQILKDNHQALAEAYLDTRQSIDNLRLTPQEGLVAWMERTLREFEQAAGVQVQRMLDPQAAARAHAVSPEVQAQLIRIVQEALSNIRKHARASTVQVILREWQRDLILEIADNGVGFDADDVPEISRYGLRGMRERAELIGAEFQVISQAHHGTTVRLTIPALAEEAA